MRLDIIGQRRRVMRFTFGKDDKTHSWLHEKLMTIKLTTCRPFAKGTRNV